MASIVMTILTLIAVIIVMVGVLYGLKWVMAKTPGHLFKGSDRLKIIERHPLDNKRSFVRCQFADAEYIFLLGTTDLLLDKRPLTEVPNG